MLRSFLDGKIALGFMVGISLVLGAGVYFDFWGLFPTVSNEFWAAILGAIFGGIIGLFGQLISIADQQAERQRLRFEADNGYLLNLFQKTNEISGNIMIYQKHLDEGVKDSKKYDLPLAVATMPLSSPAEKIRFSPEEKLVLFKLEKGEMYNLVSILDFRVDAGIEAFQKFEEMREKLMNLVSLKVDNEGSPRHTFREEDALEVQGRASTLKHQLEMISENFDDDKSEVDRLLQELVSLLEIRLDRKFNLRIKQFDQRELDEQELGT